MKKPKNRKKFSFTPEEEFYHAPDFITKEEQLHAVDFFTYLKKYPNERVSEREQLKYSFLRFLTIKGGKKHIPFFRTLYVLSEMKVLTIKHSQIVLYSQDFFPQSDNNQVNNNDNMSQEDDIQEEGNKFKCTFCSLKFEKKEGLEEHLKSKSHKFRESISFLEGPKGGICLSGSNTDPHVPVEFPDVNLTETKSVMVYIFNIGDVPQTLTQIIPTRLPSCFTIIDPYTNLNQNVEIGPNQYYYIAIQCTPSFMGFVRFTLRFQFKGPFVMVLARKVKVVDSHLEDQLKAFKPYEKKEIHVPKHQTYVPGIKPNQLKIKGFKNSLKLYDIPSNIGGKKENEKFLSEGLQEKNYSAYFSTLLFLEEKQMQKDISKYTMFNASLIQDNQGYLKLKVPGLAEKRPSILYGDSVIASFEHSPNLAYEGCVHRIEKEQVSLKFSPEFNHLYKQNGTCIIEFTFNRIPLRRAHQAIELMRIRDFANFLFPFSSSTSLNSKSLPEFFNPLLNSRQKLAVENILTDFREPFTPFLIFGPPGTGKTITVIESIQQIFKKHYDSKILACAPSNSAADLLVQKLKPFLSKSEKSTMIRINAFNRNYENCPEDIREFCYTNSSGVFDIPQNVFKYRIVITTCVTAGVLYSVGLGENHFTHIFIDEAGYATEPECLISFAGLISRKYTKKIVLAGDPQQLGPVIRSPLAKKGGLEISFLERIWKLPIYRKDSTGQYPKAYIVKLNQNYRSHPAIIEIPAQLFYDNELESYAEPSITHLFLNKKLLPNLNVPIIFHCLEGKDEQEEDSPSWFNVMEIAQVKSYVMKIRDLGIKFDDIGIISPYRKQVQKISIVLDKSIKVGTVEEFQGQERKVIIISTVRSSKEFQEIDEEHNLGFLKNPKRFNVAITRAQSLLIVVGNPYILSKDDNWNKFIKFCQDKNAMVGAEYKPNDEEILLEELKELKGEEKEETQESDEERSEDIRWNDDY